jgi:hypothetical protein
VGIFLSGDGAFEHVETTFGENALCSSATTTTSWPSSPIIAFSTLGRCYFGDPDWTVYESRYLPRFHFRRGFGRRKTLDVLRQFAQLDPARPIAEPDARAFPPKMHRHSAAITAAEDNELRTDCPGDCILRIAIPFPAGARRWMAARRRFRLIAL